MSNSISLIGRLTKDSELKSVGSTQVLEFSLASDTGFGDKKVGSFYNCKLWGKRGESMASHLVKGKQLFVCGELTLRPFGEKRLSPDVNVSVCDFIGSKGDNAAPASTGMAQANSSPSDEESLPF